MLKSSFEFSSEPSFCVISVCFSSFLFAFKFVVDSDFIYPTTPSHDILYQFSCISNIFNCLPLFNVNIFCAFSFGSVITASLSAVTYI